MSFQRFSFVLMIFLILISDFNVTGILAEAVESEAASALTDADRSVISAYQAVLEAEQAGADVSGLLDQLNDAGRDLTLANEAYVHGDFEKTIDFSSSSKNIAEEVQSLAVDLKNSAFYESVQRMWWTVIGSIVGVIAVCLGGLWIWGVLKRRYHGRVLGMKPEVKSVGS